jgi:nucleolar protein 12
MDSTTKSTNAYAVYSTKMAAREAVKRLNGTVVLGRHLRVDSVAHPAKVDHRRCVFVGNLGFVDDESKSPNADEDQPKKKNKPPSDVEEGLWVQFSKAGKVESVRVPRDAKTRVGKGFAYVQFEDQNAVEAALQFNDQKYPPLLPRKLRVTRARAEKKKKERKGTAPPPSKSDESAPKGAYKPKISAEEKSQGGRAKAMLGKASKYKSAESFVFEGHRASSKQGTSGLKLGGKKKGPNGRKSRSKAWKASGGKK